jgi:DNA polymerase-4
LSLDEAYLDVTGSAHFNGSATRIGQEIRALIKNELNLTASVGVAPNKFLAKIASDWKKPDGQFVIRPQDITTFMPPLKIEKIHGVGQVTAAKMHKLGMFVCGDIQKQSLAQLLRWFGSRGADLRELSFGIDGRAVQASSVRKSLTVETTFGKDLKNPTECMTHLPKLYHEWESRMSRLRDGDRIRGYVVKLKFHDFKTTTHETSSAVMPTLADFERLLLHAWERRREPVRLIGIGVRLAAEGAAAVESRQLRFDL